MKRQTFRAITRIVLPYLIFAGLWIFFSDRLLEYMNLAPEDLTRLSIYKGMAFVAVTAVLLTSLLLAESRAREITLAARMQAQEKLEQNERRLRHLFSVSPSIVYTLNPDDHSITWVSRNVTTLLGYPPEEVLRPGFWKAIVHPEDIPSVRDGARTAIRAGKGVREYRLFRKNGEAIWVHDDLLVLADEENNPKEIICALTDITERKRSEQERIRLQVAEQASRAKSAFVAHMSHEIRTPLNAILGFARMLERDPALTADQAERVRTIIHSGNHLLSLVNNILDFSKIESGKLELAVEGFNLHDLLDDVAAFFRPQAEARGLAFRYERGSTVPPFVSSDWRKLRQILLNLLGNAVKFTKEGSITFRAQAESLQDEGNREAERDPGVLLSLEVEDTGPGIPPEDLDAIFQEFSQSSAGKETGGTGLGLAITKRLVLLLGGDVSVRSVPGQGSTFRVCLPVLSDHDWEGTPGRDSLVSKEIGAVPRELPGEKISAESTPVPGGDFPSVLPEGIRSGMVRALERGDILRLRELAAEAAASDETAGKRLRDLVAAFDYEQLARILGMEEDAFHG
ncbi:MAG TPA: ATP-binding protein [Aminivibrio sp.]|uniref:PAS domain-containing sensor histidine kinase n=1 Tax=Aminivibrio sp. TaxID=1872489 RepID=UPI002C4ABF8F|nr:ATP-binding protein [Aminivibrio sp.]HPF85396.1 ATP-binding protein [Aminivibrio sp.]